MIKGGDEIVEEVRRRVRPLLDEGGFIASVDHKVPYDVSYSNYCRYLNVLKTELGIRS
ncbi:MAG: hypothetical protein ACUVQ8_02545 [Nitrososphaeria archaeon]